MRVDLRPNFNYLRQTALAHGEGIPEEKRGRGE